MEYLYYLKTAHDRYIGKYGAIIVDGKLTLAYTKPAYATGTEPPYYKTEAYNLLDEDEKYVIEWKLRTDLVDDYLKAQGRESKYKNMSYYDFLLYIYSGDEYAMCDWDNPWHILRC